MRERLCLRNVKQKLERGVWFQRERVIGTARLRARLPQKSLPKAIERNLLQMSRLASEFLVVVVEQLPKYFLHRYAKVSVFEKNLANMEMCILFVISTVCCMF